MFTKSNIASRFVCVYPLLATILPDYSQPVCNKLLLLIHKDGAGYDPVYIALPENERKRHAMPCSFWLKHGRCLWVLSKCSLDACCCLQLLDWFYTLLSSPCSYDYYYTGKFNVISNEGHAITSVTIPQYKIVAHPLLTEIRENKTHLNIPSLQPTGDSEEHWHVDGIPSYQWFKKNVCWGEVNRDLASKPIKENQLQASICKNLRWD